MSAFNLVLKTRDYRLVFFSLFLIIITNSVSAQSSSQTCQMTRGLRFNFFASTENQISGAFGIQADRLPPAVISNCRGSGGKVLGIGLGLRLPSLTSDAADVSFDGSFRADTCRIQNSKFSLPMSFQERRENFERQFKLLRSCTFLELTHLDNKPIRFSENQKFCRIKKQDNGKVIAEGDFCYVKIQPDLRLVVGVGIKPSCSNANSVVQNQIPASDIEALLQAFVVDDESSLVTENMIGSSRVRFSMMPSSKLVSVSQELGPEQPAFPDTFSADIHMGSIKIYDGSFGDDIKTFFDLSLLVDTRVARSCNSGLCVGPGDYQQPLAGEVEISEITKSGPRVLDSWASGNPSEPFMKGSWQGLFRLGRKTTEGLQVEQGNTYELKIEFYNPYDDYLMLIKGYEQLLVDLTLLNGTAGIDVISSINSLRSLLGLPQIPQLPSLGKVQIEDELEKVRKIMAQLGPTLAFPPYYRKLCSLDLKTCQATNSRSKYLVLKTRFKVSGVNDEDRSMKLTDIVTTRESKIMQAYRQPVTGLPELRCQ